ncbi:MAG TPA: 50S ribosomal protein L11 methyltransferase [Aestuariivirgaceae bacterium]|nr:50S ribosomal protein L11 methyltransferase [Aestuariivirgaceae bacterium]
MSDAIEPEAQAVSLIETDERLDLWRVEAYYEEAPCPEALGRLGLAPAELSIELLPETDWVARSLAGLAPVRAGRFIVHGSHDRVLPPGGCSVEISAGTAFGTGHHATTRGCLIAADRLLKRRRPGSILDLGSGTGVLAIAAAKASRAPALAVDIDAEAVRVTRDNARLNEASNLVKAALALPAIGATAGATRRFDLIFANILAGPLVGLAPELVARLEPRGALVLSGLTVDQERQVAATYRNRGLRLDRRLRLDNWSILVFLRPARAKRKGPAGHYLPGPRCRRGSMPLTGPPPQTMRRISLRLRPISFSRRSSSPSSWRSASALVI